MTKDELAVMASRVSTEAVELRKVLDVTNGSRYQWAAYDCLVRAGNALTSAIAWLNEHERNQPR